jgi:hypothetical protein
MSLRPLLALALWVLAVPAGAALPALQPFLDRHCLDCHDGDARKGGLDLTALSREGADAAAHKKWVRVFDRVTAGEMPPPKQAKPKASEKQSFLAALGGELSAHHATHKGTVLRRLNRREYQNSLNDVLGVNVDVLDLLPEDGRAFGFDTIGEALSISGVQLQRSMEAAEVALNAALLHEVRPPTTRELYTLDSERNQMHFRNYWLKREDGAIVVFNNGNSPTTLLPGLQTATPGTYKVSVTGYGYQTSEPVVFALIVSNADVRGDATIHSFHELPAGRPGTIEVMVPLERGDGIKISPQGLEGPSGQSPAKNGPGFYRGQGLALQGVTVEGPLLDSWPPKGQERLLGAARVRERQPAEPARRGRPPPRRRNRT